MTKENFLTLRWNNLLSVALGLVLLMYVAVAVSNSAMSDSSTFIGLVVLGVVY